MRMWRWAGGRRWWEAVGKRLRGGGDVVGDGGRWEVVVRRRGGGTWWEVVGDGGRQ